MDALRHGDVLQDAADEGGAVGVEVSREGGRVALAGEDALDGGGDAPVLLFELGQDLFDLSAGFRTVLVGAVAFGDGGDATQDGIEAPQDLGQVLAGADEAGFCEFRQRRLALVGLEGVAELLAVKVKGLANGWGQLGGGGFAAGEVLGKAVEQVAEADAHPTHDVRSHLTAHASRAYNLDHRHGTRRSAMRARMKIPGPVQEALMSKRIETLLLDLDGTLVDSFRAHFASWKAALEDVGIVITKADLERVSGLDSLAAARVLCPKIKPRQLTSVIKRKDEVFATLAPKMKPCHGAQQLVAMAKAWNLMVVVLTSSSERDLRVMLHEVLSLQDEVDLALSVERAGRSKPHPNILTEAIQRVGGKPQTSVMVGDSAVDVEMARNASVFSVAVAPTQKKARAMAKLRPGLVVKDLREFTGLLREWRQGQPPSPRHDIRVQDDHVKVFVSSTVENLRELRANLRTCLSDYRMDVFLSDSHGPSWNTSAQECLRQIRECDIFILILADEYGYVPESPQDSDLSGIFDGRISVTHGEYRYSKQLNKPCLVYIMDLKVKDARQTAFRNEIDDFFTGEFRFKFKGGQELLARVINDVLSLVTRLLRGGYHYPDETPFELVYCDTWSEAATVGAQRMLDVIVNRNNPCLSLTSGRTVSAVYRQFIELYSKQQLRDLFRRVELFSNNEYFGVEPGNPRSIRGFLEESFLHPLQEAAGADIISTDKIHYLPGTVSRGNLANLCAEYDARVGQAVINLQVLGACPIGTTLFVEPDRSSFDELKNQRTSIVSVSDHTMKYGFPELISPHVLTIGIGNILSRSEELILLLMGKDKADIAQLLLMGRPTNSSNPTLVLRVHRKLTVVLDKDAAAKLPRGWREHLRVTLFKDWARERKRA